MRSAMRVGGGAGGEDMMVAVIMGPCRCVPHAWEYDYHDQVHHLPCTNFHGK